MYHGIWLFEGEDFEQYSNYFTNVECEFLWCNLDRKQGISFSVTIGIFQRDYFLDLTDFLDEDLFLKFEGEVGGVGGRSLPFSCVKVNTKGCPNGLVPAPLPAPRSERVKYCSSFLALLGTST